MVFITIPKSSRSERVKENADVFDSSIAEDDIKLLVRFSAIYVWVFG